MQYKYSSKDVMLPNLINMVTWKLSVCILIVCFFLSLEIRFFDLFLDSQNKGNVNYPSSQVSRIVLENGNRMSWPRFNSSPV